MGIQHGESESATVRGAHAVVAGGYDAPNAGRALIVEAVGYNPRGGNLFDVLHAYSNSLTSASPGFEDEDFLPRVDNFAEMEGEAETFRGAVQRDVGVE